MVTIKNRQRKIVVDSEKVLTCAQKMLDMLNYSDFDLNIFLTTNQTIRNFNKKFRNKDAATDILSFPFYSDVTPEQKIIATSNGEKVLGDIIISLEYAQKDALPKWNRNFDDHLIALLAHGVAHLIGYDHQADEDFKKMLRIEKRLCRV